MNLQPKGQMKKQYMRVRKEKKDFSVVLTQQEANVEMGISSTRGTVKVLREEIINGKKFLVLSV
mgnify:FL=1